MSPSSSSLELEESESDESCDLVFTVRDFVGDFVWDFVGDFVDSLLTGFSSSSLELELLSPLESLESLVAAAVVLLGGSSSSSLDPLEELLDSCLVTVVGGDFGFTGVGSGSESDSEDSDSELISLCLTMYIEAKNQTY